MSLSIVQTHTVSSDGTLVLIQDITGTTASTAYGVGGNITYANIKAVRIKCGTATTIQNQTTLTAGTSFIQYTEYIMLTGSPCIVNNKHISVGGVFVAQLDSLTVPASTTFGTTGYYVYPVLATWLPDAAGTILSLSINNIGQDGNYVETNEYLFPTEIYYSTFTISTAAISGNSYMVLSGTCTYTPSGGSSNIYMIGDKFTADDTSNIVPTGSVVIQYATADFYATLAYSLMTSILLLIQERGVNGTAQFYDEIYQIKSQLDSLDFANSTLNVDFTYATDLLTMLQNKVTYLSNNSV